MDCIFYVHIIWLT